MNRVRITGDGVAEIVAQWGFKGQPHRLTMTGGLLRFEVFEREAWRMLHPTSREEALMLAVAGLSAQHADLCQRILASGRKVAMEVAQQ